MIVFDNLKINIYNQVSNPIYLCLKAPINEIVLIYFVIIKFVIYLQLINVLNFT